MVIQQKNQVNWNKIELLDAMHLHPFGGDHVLGQEVVHHEHGEEKGHDFLGNISLKADLNEAHIYILVIINFDVILQ